MLIKQLAHVFALVKADNPLCSVYGDVHPNDVGHVAFVLDVKPRANESGKCHPPGCVIARRRDIIDIGAIMAKTPCASKT
jgi:hypothetical protein